MKKPILKDIEKAYPLGGMNVAVWNRMGREIAYGEVWEIHHWNVIRDYTLVLKGGVRIQLDADVVQKIIEHERDGK